MGTEFGSLRVPEESPDAATVRRARGHRRLGAGLHGRRRLRARAGAVTHLGLATAYRTVDLLRQRIRAPARRRPGGCVRPLRAGAPPPPRLPGLRRGRGHRRCPLPTADEFDAATGSRRGRTSLEIYGTCRSCLDLDRDSTRGLRWSRRSRAASWRSAPPRPAHADRAHRRHRRRRSPVRTSYPSRWRPSATPTRSHFSSESGSCRSSSPSTSSSCTTATSRSRRAPTPGRRPRRGRPVRTQLPGRPRNRARVRIDTATGLLVFLAVVSHDFADGPRSASSSARAAAVGRRSAGWPSTQRPRCSERSWAPP